MLRLLAFDLDGTLLDTTSSVPERNRLALKAAADRGLHVLLVSGRHHMAIAALHRHLALPSPVICCNGAYVYDFARAEISLPSPMSAAQSLVLLDLCRAAGLYFIAYTPSGMYYDLAAPGQTLETVVRLFPAAGKSGITRVEDVRAVIDREPVFKFVIAEEVAGVLKGLKADIAALSGYSADFSWVDRLDVSAEVNSKGGKLVEWAASHGIAPSDIAAFGDQENDISMLSKVGMSFAMGSAPDHVRAVARETIGDNDSTALADTVHRLLAGL